MKINLLKAGWLTAFLVTGIFACPSAARAAAAVGSETEVRGAIESAFQQLRSGQYDALYDVLPVASQRKITRDRFARALARTRDVYELDRMDVGAIRVAGNLAVADTTIYGRVRRPFEGEGKIAAQQYLIRENGRWHIATGDRTTQKQMLDEHPEFARRFPVREPRIYLKRDGQWVDLGSLGAIRDKMRSAK